MEINNNKTGAMPQMTDDMGMTLDADALGQKIVETVQALAEVLSGENVHVSQPNGIEKDHGPKGSKLSAPELDEADLEKAGQADLEVFIAYLQMKMDEKMANVQGKRIESLKGQLESAHKTQMGKIEKSIKEAKKQETTAKIQKWLGWITAVVAVVSAFVVSVMTGGVAAGFAFAGAAMALSSAIMNQTGATKAICKAISKSLQENNGISKTEADALAQAIYAGVEMCFAVACGLGGAASSGIKTSVDGVSKLVKVAKCVQCALKFVSPFLQLGGQVVSGISIAFSAGAGAAQADATESQQYLVKLQKLLEECQEDLEAILDQLMQTGTDTLALLESQTDTASKITEEISQQNA